MRRAGRPRVGCPKPAAYESWSADPPTHELAAHPVVLDCSFRGNRCRFSGSRRSFFVSLTRIPVGAASGSRGAVFRGKSREAGGVPYDGGGGQGLPTARTGYILKFGSMDTSTIEPRVFDRMSALGDLARGRLLILLEQGEFTVSELVQVSQLPQSTVSRHLKILADDGWVTSRASGTSRFYRMAVSLDPAAQELWGLVRPDVAAAGLTKEDDERARAVLRERRGRSREFFSGVALRWDSVREELFGSDSEMFPLFGLLDPTATVGDLGAGTGHFAALVAPFVGRVIAVDASEEMLAAARDRLGGLDRLDGASNVDLRCGDLESLPIDDGELDVAVLLLVLHYVVDPPIILKEAWRALKPGGRLIVVDMRPHSREGYQEEMGHAWPGFDEADLASWHRDAGLADFAYRPLPARPEASGPLLFVTSATRAC